MAAIRLAHDSRFSMVVFTGGEATLRHTDLMDGVRLASSLGLKSRLVTNGWWGRTESAAGSVVRELRSSGLSEINFSTGDEHARFVPISNVFRSVNSALREGFDPYVMIEVRSNAKLTKAVIVERDDFKGLGSMLARVTFTESPWMPTDAREHASYPPQFMINRTNVATKTGCDSIFSTHTVQPDGAIAVCCGLGIRRIPKLSLGDFHRESTSFLRLAAVAELDLTKLLIKQFGPERTLARLSKLDPSIVWEDMYAHKCQACIRIMSDLRIDEVIRHHEGELLVEVAGAIAVERAMAVGINVDENCIDSFA